MKKEKIFNIFETIYLFYSALIGLWVISGSWKAFVANLCIVLVGAGFTFISAYIIIGFCKLLEDLLKEDDHFE